ncbi:MAG: MnhB domain-containing protein [Ignavibacteriales bacterium]
MQNKGMTLIVKTVTRITVWLIILYGFYIILHGHLTPGGGFGGGVIIALALLNVLLAFGRDFTGKWLNIKLLQDIEASTATLFLIVGILGFASGGAFLANFLSHGSLFRLISSGTILPLNIIIGIKVGMSLFLVVWVLSAIDVEKGDEQ